MMRFDLHIHSNISACSNLALNEIVTKAGERNLDGVCITDHQSMAARKYLCEGVQSNGVCVLIGMEYATSDGDFLLFGPFENIVPGLSARQLLETVRLNGGAAIAAHPFRADRPVQEYVIRENLCQVVESINGRNTTSENAKMDAWRGHFFFSECSGSDAHSPEEVGRFTTEFDLPIRTRDDLIFALKNGLCTPGPSVG